MPLTKVTSSLINTVSASQIVATGATAGQVLTYNGSTSTWVASAASTGFTSNVPLTGTFNASLSANGYQKLPTGLIIQWGKITNVSLQQVWQTITFPISFPTAVLNASTTIATANFTSDSPSAQIQSTTITTNGMSVGGDYYAVSTGNGDFYWTAIGY